MILDFFVNSFKNIFTKSPKGLYPMDYSECEPFMPLHDGDRAYCCKIYDGDTVTLCWLDNRGNKVRIGVV